MEKLSPVIRFIIELLTFRSHSKVISVYKLRIKSRILYENNYLGTKVDLLL